MPPDRGEQDMPSSSSEDGLESPAPALPTRGVGKSYAAVVAEPPPKSSGSEEGKAAGKSSFTGPVRGRKRARAKESRGSGRDGGEDTGGKAPVEPVTPQKVGEKWTASEGGEEAKGTKQEQEKLVSGDFSHYRRGIQVHFAPLRIPLERRLQTAALLWHSSAIALFISLFWYLILIPLTWPLLVPYLIYILFSNAHRDGSSPAIRSPYLRSHRIWRFYTSYFPLRLHRSTPLSPDRNYIFACHPHGIISHGAFGNFCTEGTTGFENLFPGITNTLLTLDSNFRIPFYREYLLKMGLASVSRRSCEALLRGEGGTEASTSSSWFSKLLRSTPTPPPPQPLPSGGRAISIVIGGARESLEAIPGTMSLVLRRRRGFLKLAIRENAGVVPVLSFGENDLYDQLVPAQQSLLWRLQRAVGKTVGFTVPFFHARGVFNYDVGFLAYRKEVNTVVGRPIFPKEQNDHPRDAEVDELQELYIAELQRIWDQWKDVFSKDRKGELVVVE